jgi:hypothetical protein
MKDRTLTCIQCGNEFVFSAEEHGRFLAQGFNMPRRCPDCRKKKAKWVEINDDRQEKGKKKHRHSRRKEDYDLFK